MSTINGTKVSPPILGMSMKFHNETNGMFMIHKPANVHILGPKETSAIGIKKNNKNFMQPLCRWFRFRFQVIIFTFHINVCIINKQNLMLMCKKVLTALPTKGVCKAFFWLLSDIKLRIRKIGYSLVSSF